MPAVLPVLTQLRGDSSLYVKKSVANLLRDGGKSQPALVLETAARWAADGDRHTDWIVKNGLKKLIETHPAQVKPILEQLQARTP